MKLSETQTIVLNAGAQRPDNIALPLPKRLAGAAAKMAVGKMIERGSLQEVNAKMRRGEPLWRETGDGNGTTLVVTAGGLLAIGIEPPTVKTMSAVREGAHTEPVAKRVTPRAGTKQALLIAMLLAPQGATMEEIIAETQWLPHTARGAMSEALGKKPLRANKSETFACLKFTLDGAGERSDGYARTSAHAFGLFA